MKYSITIVFCLCLIAKTLTSVTTVQAHQPAAFQVQQHALPPNFIIRPDKKAELLVPSWVKYINQRNYDAAADLWVPEERDWRKNNPVSQRFIKNIERIRLLQFKDVTLTWGGNSIDLGHFYAVKVYIAILDYKAYDWQIAQTMLGKKMQRCFVVKATKSSPWKLYMMQGYSPYDAPKNWGLDMSGVTGYGPEYHPDFPNLNASKTALYQNFIKQCIGPAVQKAVDHYYGRPRRIAYWEMDILHMKQLTEGAYWFEITVRVRSSQGPLNPSYGVETITLTNNTKKADFEVVKYVHQDDT